MGRITKIGWCHHTHNGVHGCAHATLADGTESPGCENCYAEKGSKRNPKTLGTWGEEGTRVLAADSAWAQLDTWHRAAVRDGELRRVFCYSIGDVFESPRSLANKEVCIRGRALLFEAIERLVPWKPPPDDDDWNTATRQAFERQFDHQWASVHVPCGLIFLLLTKRPENIKRMVPASWLQQWPQHVWLGTSVENQQAADERIPWLLDVPGVPVRFLSMEPLLERVHVRWLGLRVHGFSCLGWVIAGGESGHRARPCDLAWLRDLRDQCKAAGVPFFNKQAGAYPVESSDPRQSENGRAQMLRVGLVHRKGEDPSEWPADLRVREVPEVRL